MVLPNGMFSISDRGATIISFREKGEKRGNGGRRRSKSVPPFFSVIGRAKSGGRWGWGRVVEVQIGTSPLNNFFPSREGKNEDGGRRVRREEGPFLPYASIMPLVNTPLITPWDPGHFINFECRM